MSSSSNSSSVQLPSRFIEHIEDTTRNNIDEATHGVEMIERDQMVELLMGQWKKEYPEQWKKLDCEARFKSEDDTSFNNNTEGIAGSRSVHVRWHEKTMARSKQAGVRYSSVSPPKQSHKSKVAQRIATAKKVLCFGGLTPDEVIIKVH